MRKPRIGLNAHLLSLQHGYRSAGVSRYIHYLLRYLPQVDRRAEYVAFVGDARAHYDGWQMRAPLWPTGDPLRRILWEQLVQPLATRRAKLDLLHAPVYVGPLCKPCLLVVTIHDLSFYIYPEFFRPFQRRYLQHFTRWTSKRADQIIAVSESTRRDVIRFLGVAPDRVVTIPNGVEEIFRPLGRARLEAFRRRNGLPERMILFLGTLEPRKNLLVLLEAYALLRQRGAQEMLVVAGGKGWYYESVYATVERLGLRRWVIFPGYVPWEELPLWYNAAELFVYPSLYEGFGLPPLEAMACGVPVVVSNVSSLPEVVGEAGVLVDPQDPQGLAVAMEELLADPARREELAEAGLARARSFSWERTALQTAQLYHRMLGEGDGASV
ncbi:MAG: glycosyltransferase family 4 protein [Anaerolineae bacterium]|nr:glycosyltransferase family 4 protein [Anaerolineae bacterium]